MCIIVVANYCTYTVSAGINRAGVQRGRVTQGYREGGVWVHRGELLYMYIRNNAGMSCVITFIINKIIINIE